MIIMIFNKSKPTKIPVCKESMLMMKYFFHFVSISATRARRPHRVRRIEKRTASPEYEFSCAINLHLTHRS
jgi:hypothetical protein